MNFIKRKYYQLLVKFLKNKPNSDVDFIKAKYFLKNNKQLNIENPQEFTEKLQWLNLNLYNEDYKDFVDKYEVRKYVEKKIGEGFLVDFIAVFNDVDEIDFNVLPNQFVLKATHGSGYNIIIKDKSKIDITEVKRTLNKYLKSNYYDKYKERVYKKVQPRILIEHYLEEVDGENVLDYKFFCVHGEVIYIFVLMRDKDGKKKYCFYDLDWNKIKNDNPSNTFLSKDIERPDNLNELLSVAKKLAEGFIFIRVDLYSIEGKIYFGELTFFPTSGLQRLYVERLNKELGELMHLPIESGA
ncbi:ATP-grasp fold amidoligase family protein [Winogradskyella marincola]|uniref:ATP-grasp fold amidoligase family protein n=1 Tax=Winogradskyella marincola TaxID=3037795 RepID=A0ABT6G374_9FLAO|nr:ATP-grasp fold amidoligase family protein [Winogradskyella sp. YYF002]MDG4716357.1 ATP-grasp fold amidoligase family protein [Winogradskyella sp. YYF002]